MSGAVLDFDTWNTKLAEAMTAVGDDQFVHKLYAAIAALAPHIDPIIWVYPTGKAPFALDSRGDESDSGDVEAFFTGPYLLDPFYLAGAEHCAEGFYRFADLAPESFRETEYYRSYYVRIHMHDEVGYIAYYQGDSFANISFGRRDTQAPFTQEEIDLLRSISPTVCQLVRQHMALAYTQSDAPSDELEKAPGQFLRSGLQHFGTSLLTEREQEVIHLFLRGHSTKSAAEKLGISPETIKLHRKNSYAKLDVASQAELFVLFIDSVAQSGPQPGEDPLIRYLAVPPSV